MKLYIGDKIKQLRKQNGYTQEQLAESIGVSFQAVSKWENNLAFPDIMLVPVLAAFFNVTIDELFVYNPKEMKKEIDSIVDEACKYRENDYQKARRILESGLQKYPENDILLRNLLYVLPDADETIQMANKLIRKTNRIDIKYDALRFLAFAYNRKGNTESALEVIEQIPEMDFTKLSEMAFILTGKPKFEAAEKQKWISLENLIQMIANVMEYYKAAGDVDKSIKEAKKALALIKLFSEEDKDERLLVYVKFFCKQLERMRNE